jgi:uncharacterized membrane protein
MTGLMVAGFSVLDAVALTFFLVAWVGYHFTVESGHFARRGLNGIMAERRKRWFAEAVRRDNRIVDTQIMGGLQNGTAFFASTSLIAIGGALALLQATDQMLAMFFDLPLMARPTRAVLELKIIGMAVIFAYAFFKFGWSYRLFNYSAILLGTIPDWRHSAAEQERIEAACAEAASMNIAAGRHFNRGQRSFFFAIAYLGWFLGPVVLLATTTGVIIVMWRRQFSSDAVRALQQYREGQSS